MDKAVYPKFVSKLKTEVEKIQVGPGAEDYNMGAVINENAQRIFLTILELANGKVNF